MKVRPLIFAVLVLCNAAFAQGFVNLNFEYSIVTNLTTDQFGYYIGDAIVPGWQPSTIVFNEMTLNRASVSLVGTNLFQPLQGNYSILLQGGNLPAPYTNGASIGQTGQIPLTAKTILFWGDSLQVTFNGQMLSIFAMNNTPNYTVWVADVSAYSGQTGNLVFTAPWQNTGGLNTGLILDNIQFSSTPVPEPGGLAIYGLGVLFLGFRIRCLCS
jgi:hypothetical protein